MHLRRWIGRAAAPLPLLFGLAVALAAAAGVARARQPPAPRDYAKESARRDTPAWVTGGVFYEIFPRNFSAAGDLDGVTAELDRLRALGVNILWLMPVHPTGERLKKGTIGSPYAVRDFYAINPAYGTKEDFRRLVREAHARGLRVIMDLVANHTSWDSVMMATPEYYKRDAAGRVLPIGDCCPDVAKLDYDNPRLRAYMTEMLKYWVREFDVDGFRCDIAYAVPTDFWEAARRELERVKPDIVMLAESQEPDHLSGAFDVNYDWPLFHAVGDVIAGGKPATVLREVWQAERARMPRGALRMRFSDNHDELRATARFGRRGALAASALLLTLDGVPMLYNGMEVGDATESSDPALFERVPILWQVNKRPAWTPRFYARLIALRRAHAALQQGEVEWLRNSAEARVVTYARRAGGEEFVVAVNLSGEPFVGTVEAGGGGRYADVTPDASAEPDAPAPKERTASLPALALDAWGYRILRRHR